MILLVVFVLIGAGVIVWRVRFKKSAEQTAIRTLYEPFHSVGDQVKPHLFMEKLPGLDRHSLARRNGWLEFYPNQKIIALCIPPSTKIFCYCSLLEYLDLTRAIEKKILYGVSPPIRSAAA